MERPFGWLDSGRIYLNWVIRTYLYNILPIAIFLIPFYPFLTSGAKMSIYDFRDFLTIWCLSFLGLAIFLSYVAFQQALLGTYRVKDKEKGFRIKINATNIMRAIIWLWAVNCTFLLTIKLSLVKYTFSLDPIQIKNPLILIATFFVGWFIFRVILNFSYRGYSLEKVFLKDDKEPYRPFIDD